MANKVHTRLRLSGVDMTLRSDDQLSVTMRPIDAAGDLRRTVNGDLIKLSRSVFDKYAISISGSGLNTPAITHLTIGKYIEVVLPDHVYMKKLGNFGAEFPRIMVDVEGWTIAGQKVLPTQQPDTQGLATNLSQTYTPARVAALRQYIDVEFPSLIHTARGRPVLACRVVDLEIDNDDVSKQSSWSLELEEL